MAVYDNVRTQYQAGALASLIARTAYVAVQSVSELRAALVRWNNARITRNSLLDLTDRELDDIGLTRADIDAVARTY